MSNEKNPEVVGCDASIMTNVWAIREREYTQKIQQEQDRIDKSALPSINQDWANRLASRQGTYKRVERKNKPAENPIDNDNIWKSKVPAVPPALPRGTGSGPLGKPGTQSRGFSRPAKDKKGQDKNFQRLQLLMFITQTQPSAMVWGKSWKYNKSLPLAEAGAEARSNWGQCWMFATQQPYSEAGQPWLNGPNLMDPHSLHLWKKPDYKMVQSQELDLSLSTEEWQLSWRKFDTNNKKKDASSKNEENVAKSGFFTLLVETQHRNETLCSSEWSESWRSTKQASQQDRSIVPNDGHMNESIDKQQGKDRQMRSSWEEGWRLANHHGCNKSNNPSLRQDHSDTFDDRSQSHLHKIMLVSREQKHRELYLNLCNEFKALSEWSKSWQVTKNNSKPCEEIEKILKALPPMMEIQKVENNSKEHYSSSEKEDLFYKQLKHCVIYRPKREFTQSQLLHLKHMENVLSSSEWRDSWKALRHRVRMERRRMRPEPSRPFRASEEGGDMKPTASEWKDSWKFTCQPLRQEPESWQQGWSTTPQIRVDRARDQNHFAPVELPKNGPTAERSWGESWRFSRHQRQSEPGQGRAQTSQARSSGASHHPSNSQAQRMYNRPLSDWQMAWMVTGTQFHHDRPSLTQWREAWRSVYQTEHWTEQVREQENEVDLLMEIQPPREKMSLQRAKAKMSRSFDNQMFRERYPEKQWNASWRAEPLLNHQPSYYGSSKIPGKSMSSTTQQQHTTENGHGSKWGKSFRLANPTPHMEQPWVESSPNPCHYAVMWSRGKNIRNNIYLNNNLATLRLWVSSCRFLQGASAQIKDKSKSKKPVDPRVIIPNKTKTRMHLYSKIEKEKQSERKWAGCHLLGKTQPRPKRGAASMKNFKMEDNTTDKFFEEWVESWRFSVRPGGLKKQMAVKSLSGWNESWKFLLPPYPPMNGHKAK